MSQSTDAILFYGIPLDVEEDGEFDIDGLRFNGEAADYFEINEDWVKLKGPLQPKDTGDYTGEAWDVWRVALREFQESVKCVEIDSHCSGEYPMYYVRGRQFKSHRGDINEISPDCLTVTPEDDANIKEFCERYGIHYQQPKWYLVSYWG